MIDINLDTSRQQDLYEKACQDMARQIPGWTDTFPSDPAVAVLEHLSYLSDIQNYILNQITEVHYLAYCKLLGVTPKQLIPARLLALPDPAVPCPRGRRFQISGMPFEVSENHDPDLPQITQVVFEAENSTYVLNAASPLALQGKTPCSLILTLSNMLPAQNTPYRFWVSILPETDRNPPSKITTPPVKISAQIRVGKQWQTVPCTDETYGFLQSGFLSIVPVEPTDAIAFRIHGIWENIPQLQIVCLEPVVLMQQHTRSICMDLTAPFSLPQIVRRQWKLFFFTPCNNGWKRQPFVLGANEQIHGWNEQPPETIRVIAVEPDFHALRDLQGIAMEELALEEDGLQPEQLQIMVEENGLWYDCPVCMPKNGKTLPRGCRWDPYRRAIRFGDGRDYLPPLPGHALISGCVLSAGSAANGAKGILSGSGDAKLTVLSAACGGQDAERPKEAFARAACVQNQPMRAVTCKDYEMLTRRTPGLALEQVRAIPKKMLDGSSPGVVLLVKPRSHCPQPTLSPWQHMQLSLFLKPYRLLGVPLEIRGPRYCPFRVHAVLQTTEPVSQDKLRDTLLPLADGVSGTLDFGAEISYTTLYTALCSMDGVRSVRKLEITPLARGIARSSDGGILPAADMLPCLTELDIIQSQ